MFNSLGVDSWPVHECSSLYAKFCLNQVRVCAVAVVAMPFTSEPPLMRALGWAEMPGLHVTTDNCSLIILASEVVNLKSFIIENKFS